MFDFVKKYVSGNPKEYTQGLYLYRDKNWDKAQKYFEKSIIENPTHASSYFKLGMCCFRQSDYAKASQYIKKALDLNPERIEWEDQLVEAERRLGKNTSENRQAREERIKDQITRFPNNDNLYDDLALVLRKQGKWWQEIDALRKSLQLKETADRWYRLAEALEVMNKFSEAAESFKNSINLGGKDDAMQYYRYGFALEQALHNSDVEVVKEAYNKAIENDDKLDSKIFGVGVFHQARGLWKFAKKAYQKQLKLDPFNAELNYRMGMAYDRCLDWANAEKFYVLALKYDFGNPYWHYRLGFVRERQRKWQEAADSYWYAATTIDHRKPYWFYRAGIVYSIVGNYTQACDAYLRMRKVKHLEPDQLGEDLSKDKKDPFYEAYRRQLGFSTYVKYLVNEIEQDATDYRLWEKLGNHYEARKEWDNASECYIKAIERNPQHDDKLYYRTGYVLNKGKKYQKAAFYFKQSRLLQGAYGVPEGMYKTNESFRRAAIYTEFYENLDIDSSCILYESFNGANISCNPLALFNKIEKDNNYNGFTHVWVLNDINKAPESLKKNKNVVLVPKDSILYIRYLATAKYLINNSTFPPYFIRREGQRYLNTWHGTPWKTLGKRIKSSFMELQNTQRNFLQASMILAPNEHTKNVIEKDYDIDRIAKADIWVSGYPRIDSSLNVTAIEKQKLRQRMKLDDRKVILYAPTYRGFWQSPDYDIESIKRDISALNNSGAQVLYRGHYFVEEKIVSAGIESNVVPADINSNELLSIVDVLVTDFSSIAFDFMPLQRPIIFYAEDYEDYKESRGLYFDVEELPGVAINNPEELAKVSHQAIRDQLTIDYSKGEKFIPCEDGHVSDRVLTRFFNDEHHPICNDKKNILFFAGPLSTNGITISLTNLIKKLDKNKYNACVSIDPGAINGDKDRMHRLGDISSQASILPRAGRMDLTIEEKWVLDKFNKQHELHSAGMREIYETAFKREWRRLYGESGFDSIVNFDGYARFWVSLYGVKGGNNSIFLHNDMVGEWKEKFPSQEGVFNLYDYYSKLISVSDKTNKRNKGKLENRYNLSSEKFSFIENLIDKNGVLKKAEVEIDEPDESKIFNSSGTVFISIGRHSVEKGHDILINAFKAVVDQMPSSKLILIGDGPTNYQLKQMTKELGISNNVYFMGRKNNPFKYINAADCFVIPSRHEGQGLVILEAMVLGKPIISTNFDCAYDVLDNGRYGRIVETNPDALAHEMIKFEKSKIKYPQKDIDKYNKACLEKFIHEVINP